MRYALAIIRVMAPDADQVNLVVAYVLAIPASSMAGHCHPPAPPHGRRRERLQRNIQRCGMKLRVTPFVGLIEEDFHSF